MSKVDSVSNCVMLILRACKEEDSTRDGSHTKTETKELDKSLVATWWAIIELNGDIHLV